MIIYLYHLNRSSCQQYIQFLKQSPGAGVVGRRIIHKSSRVNFVPKNKKEDYSEHFKGVVPSECGSDRNKNGRWRGPGQPASHVGHGEK